MRYPLSLILIIYSLGILKLLKHIYLKYKT